MTDQLELTLLNRQPEIARVQNELERFADGNAVPEPALHAAQLALEEHLANIVHYAYPDDNEHEITVCFTRRGAELRIVIADDGRAFSPLEHPAPDLTKPIEERPIGGLGIHMMRKSLDGLEYRRADGKNILTMIKKI